MDRNVYEKLKGMVAEVCQVDVNTLTPDTSFVHDLNCDSLMMVELVITVEEEFPLEIPDEEASRLQLEDFPAYFGTIGGMAAIIERNLGRE